MPDFFSSDAGQCASIAKQFMEGALVLDEERRARGRLLFRPTLALAGHGLEMMLKACTYLNGKAPPTKGRQGHDIVALWDAQISEPLRGAVFANARLVATEDWQKGMYPDIPVDEDIVPLVTEYVRALGKLHDGSSGYPLRYPSDPNQKAPRTPLLVKTPWRTSDDLVKRPNEFVLLN